LLCSKSAGERTVYMASLKQTVKLYWVTPDDHDEDWFIFTESARSARAYHEDYEGYGKGDANSCLIVSNMTPEGVPERNPTLSCSIPGSLPDRLPGCRHDPEPARGKVQRRDIQRGYP